MRDTVIGLGRRVREIAFAVCVICTMWLIVQNTVLFTLLPWDSMPAVLRAMALVAKALIAAFVPVALIGGTLALGWWTHRASQVRAEREMHHE